METVVKATREVIRSSMINYFLLWKATREAIRSSMIRLEMVRGMSPKTGRLPTINGDGVDLDLDLDLDFRPSPHDQWRRAVSNGM